MSITYCEQCHGVKAITYPTNNVGYAESKEVLPVGPLRFCCGHGPAPAPKHDGKLGERESVRYVEEFDKQMIWLSNGGSNDMVFYPDAMLSLLAWLKQEEEVLKRLAGGDEA